MTYKEANDYITELLRLNEIEGSTFKPFLTSLQTWNEEKELTPKQIRALNNIEGYFERLSFNGDIMIDSESIY